MFVAPGPIEVVQAIIAAPAALLGEGNGGQRHRLLVMGAERRQGLADLVERLAQPRHIAVAEDREDAGEERRLVAVDLAALRQRGSAAAPAPW